MKIKRTARGSMDMGRLMITYQANVPGVGTIGMCRRISEAELQMAEVTEGRWFYVCRKIALDFRWMFSESMIQDLIDKGPPS